MDLLQPQAAPNCFCNFVALGVTMSWDEDLPGARASRPHNDGFPGARASRPHQAWHSLGHLPHLDRPGTAPWLSFGLADAVRAHRVAACSIALKLSGGQRNRMRAGRPRSQAMPSRRCGGGCLAGDFSECRPAPFGKLPFAREPCPRPIRRGGSFESETGLFQASGAPALPGRSSEGETGLFQTSGAPALPGRSSESKTIRNRLSRRDLGIPSRLTSTP